MAARTHVAVSAPTGHTTVLLTEAIAAIQPRPGGVYVDGTFGGGGHTRALLAGCEPDGVVIALDADPDAIERALAMKDALWDRNRLRIGHRNFAAMRDVAVAEGFERVDGVLLDLGLSSFQLDHAARGFSIRLDGPLDMRFDTTQGPTAAELVNQLSESELVEMFWRNGEEPRSRQVAAAIVAGRGASPIETTRQLAAVALPALGARRSARQSELAQVFQALRIAVNDEFASLRLALDAAVDLLRPGGRLVVISFHSLEDRIVKRFVTAESAECVCPPGLPICQCDTTPRLRILVRGRKPTEAEIEANPRARSAIMRVAERVDSPRKAT